MADRPTVSVWEALADISGGQTVMLNLVDELAEDFDFEFLVPAEGHLSMALEARGIPVEYVDMGEYTLGSKDASDVATFLRRTPASLLKGYRATKEADILYANATRVFIWSALVGVATGTPVVWHLHNVINDQKTRQAVIHAGRLPSVRRIVAVSETAADQFPALASKTTVVHNGVDVVTFTPGKSSQSDAPVIGLVADLIPPKGHTTAIRALQAIDKDVTLRIAGTPRTEDSTYPQELKDLSTTVGVEERVDFCGFVTDIAAFYQSLDVLVVPSSSPFEACPMVILEAYASGLPVVGSDAGGVPEFIHDGETGYVFPAEDPASLAESVNRLLAGDLDGFGRRCRARAESDYSLKRQSAAIGAVIDDVR